jgi:hypothetical protein
MNARRWSSGACAWAYNFLLLTLFAVLASCGRLGDDERTGTGKGTFIGQKQTSASRPLVLLQQGSDLLKGETFSKEVYQTGLIVTRQVGAPKTSKVEKREVLLLIEKLDRLGFFGITQRSVDAPWSHGGAVRLTTNGSLVTIELPIPAIRVDGEITTVQATTATNTNSITIDSFKLRTTDSQALAALRSCVALIEDFGLDKR